VDDIAIMEELPADHRSGFVAIIGRPSVGKSTLLNAFVGQKIAIISEKPQTTRNRILGILTRDDAQFVFVDTPGIHKPVHKLGEYMVKAAEQAVPDSDVVLLVVDSSVPPTPEDRLALDLLQRQSQAPIILVLNKMDLLRPEHVQAHTEQYLALGSFAEWMMVSAAKAENLDKLLALVMQHLPQGPRYFPPGQVTDLTERFVAAELVREQVLRYLHQEIPHAVAVVVEDFSERRPGLTHIGATIYVEKDSQKGIVIGNKGAMLKQVGSAARQDIERELDIHAFLELWVKVRPKWRRDEAELRRVGYSTP